MKATSINNLKHQ